MKVIKMFFKKDKTITKFINRIAITYELMAIIIAYKKDIINDDELCKKISDWAVKNEI